MKNVFIITLLLTVTLMQAAYADDDLFITPETLFKNKHQYLLIDIRSSSEFKSSHIPDSINLKIKSIAKTKNLKPKKIILINRGYSSSGILKRCIKLNTQGFHVLALKGGINSWATRNLPLSVSKNNFNIFEITPLDLYKSLKSTSWLAVNISGGPVKNKYLNSIETITVAKPNSLVNKKKLFNFISTKIKNRKLLVYSKNGSGYSSILKILTQQPINTSFPKVTSNAKNKLPQTSDMSEPLCNIFFLKGGLDQFNVFTKRVLRFPIARKILNSEDDCDCD